LRVPLREIRTEKPAAKTWGNIVGQPDDEYDWLRRLDPCVHRGDACVHWSLTMEDGKTGWLIPMFYYKFCELLTHTMFRFGLCCPLYCGMPDHLHLLWLGLAEGSDQRNAMKYFRRIASSLRKQGFQRLINGLREQ
jgi:hypothetical protein